MDFGSVVGRGLLLLVDAVWAALATAVLAYFALPILWVSTRVELAAVVGGLVFGVVLAAGLALASRGERPFPATRLVVGLFRRMPTWWP